MTSDSDKGARLGDRKVAFLTGVALIIPQGDRKRSGSQET